jgi:hypothetical protein
LQTWRFFKNCKIIKSYCKSNPRHQAQPYSEVLESWMHMLFC